MGNSLGRVTRSFITSGKGDVAPLLHALEPVDPPVQIKYKFMKKKYAKFLIDGDLNISRKRLYGTIYFIHKTNESRGMSSFLAALIEDAKRNNCNTISVEFDQCGAGMIKALKKGTEAQKFSYQEAPRVGPADEVEITVTGPNVIVEKSIGDDIPTMPAGFSFEDVANGKSDGRE